MAQSRLVGYLLSSLPSRPCLPPPWCGAQVPSQPLTWGIWTPLPRECGGKAGRRGQIQGLWLTGRAGLRKWTPSLGLTPVCEPHRDKEPGTVIALGKGAAWLGGWYGTRGHRWGRGSFPYGIKGLEEREAKDSGAAGSQESWRLLNWRAQTPRTHG